MRLEDAVANEGNEDYSPPLNQVIDGDFEADSHAAWTWSASDASTPFCTAEICPDFGEDAAAAGAGYAVTGAQTAEAFNGLLSQAVNIPATSVAFLQFQVNVDTLNRSGRFLVHLDDTVLMRINADSEADYEVWLPVTIDITPFADGESHTLAFETLVEDSAAFDPGHYWVFLDEVELYGLDNAEPQIGVQVFRMSIEPVNNLPWICAIVSRRRLRRRIPSAGPPPERILPRSTGG